MAASLGTMILRSIRPLHQTWCRNLAMTRLLRNEETQQADVPEVESENTENKRKIVDVETSIRYLDSKAFVEGYGDKPVWFYYRRNFKGRVLPPTRKTCIRKGEIATASPCPVCRDEYLVLDAKNVKLLEQFICPQSGEVFDSMKTGLCQVQNRKLLTSIMSAWDQGLLEMKVPFRVYDYDDYKT